MCLSPNELAIATLGNKPVDLRIGLAHPLEVAASLQVAKRFSRGRLLIGTQDSNIHATLLDDNHLTLSRFLYQRAGAHMKLSKTHSLHRFHCDTSMCHIYGFTLYCSRNAPIPG